MRATLFAALALLCAGPAAALARGLDSGAASGSHAVASATGSITRPRQISVRVRPRPAQRVTGTWAIVCLRGAKGTSSNGRLGGRGRFTQTLRLPRGHGGKCTASASARLAGKGSIRVELLGH